MYPWDERIFYVADNIIHNFALLFISVYGDVNNFWTLPKSHMKGAVWPIDRYNKAFGNSIKNS